VNKRSGALALVGKMSAVEEDALLIGLVRADIEAESDPPRDADGAEADADDVASWSVSAESRDPQPPARAEGGAGGAARATGVRPRPGPSLSACPSACPSATFSMRESDYVLDPALIRPIWCAAAAAAVDALRSGERGEDSADADVEAAARAALAFPGPDAPALVGEAALLASAAALWSASDGAAADAAAEPAWLRSVRVHGYAFVVLSAPTLAAVRATHRALRGGFWPLALGDKSTATVKGQTYIGYVDRPIFRKELFQFRWVRDETARRQLWAGVPTATLPSLAALAVPPFAAPYAPREHVPAPLHPLEAALSSAALALARVAQAAWVATARSLGASRDATAALLEPASTLLEDDPAGTLLSASNLTAFHYGVGLPPATPMDTVHTPYHTDVGLYTIIPRCVGTGGATADGGAGLHVYDWCLGGGGAWVDVEKGAPAAVAVLFPGESGDRASNGVLMGTVHEVSHLPGERFSMALQSLPPALGIIDCTGLSAARVGPLRPSHRPQTTGAAFVAATSSARVSSNFSPPAWARGARSVGEA
jgi:hypothetical protein